MPFREAVLPSPSPQRDQAYQVLLPTGLLTTGAAPSSLPYAVFSNFFLNSDVICHRLPHVLIDLQFQSFYIKLQGCHNDGTKI